MATGTAGAAAPPTVAMANNYFDPIGLSVEPGTTVRFRIDAGSHSATAYPDRIPARADPFDSGTFSRGRFEHTFHAEGTYDYYCIPHRSAGMVGRIVVGRPGGPAEDAPIPDGSVPESEVIVERGTVAADAFDARDGGMMGPGPGMMGRRAPGWMMLVPAAFLTAGLGLAGALAYLVARRGTKATGPDDGATATLGERDGQDETDERTLRRRRERSDE